MFETFNERLKRLIEERFESVSDFARAIGKTPQTVENWLPSSTRNRISSPRGEEIYKDIATALEVSVFYLKTGEEPAIPLLAPSGNDLSRIVYINLVNVIVCAGNGHYVHTEEVIERLEISKFFLKAYGLQEPFNCSAVTVVGPSMEPLLRSGDIVIVDHTQTQPQDSIYVVRIEDAVSVKHVARLIGGKVKIFSEAPGYPAQEIEVDSPNFSIIGRVVWGGRRF